MSDSHYGSVEQTAVSSDLDRWVEEISLVGYTVVPGVLGDKDLKSWRTRIDEVYSQQEQEFGRQQLSEIKELDLARAPLLYDFRFIELAAHPTVMQLARRMLGDWFTLHLQNAIINRPGNPHHQSSWHRDLPHQNFVISRPLAVNALFAIDPFSVETGGTELLPFSHRMERLPSSDYVGKRKDAPEVPAGSIIFFDTMMFHRAGVNSSGSIRRSINHVYTAPIIKQQYDFARALGDDASLSQEHATLLGYSAQVPLDDRAWRRNRIKRITGSL